MGSRPSSVTAGPSMKKYGKLVLVDLAGSERLKVRAANLPEYLLACHQPNGVLTLFCMPSAQSGLPPVLSFCVLLSLVRLTVFPM